MQGNVRRQSAGIQRHTANRRQKPKDEKKIGTIVLWQNQSFNPKAPVLYGRIQTNYGSSLVALWKFVPRQKEQAGSSSER